MVKTIAEIGINHNGSVEIAKDLIRRFETVDNIYKNLDKIQEDVRRILEKKEKIARISLEVGTISTKKK